MIPNEEQADRSKKVSQQVSWRFRIARLGCSDNEARVSLGVVFERIIHDLVRRIVTQHAPINVPSVIKIPLIDLSDIEIFEDVINLGFLVNAEDLPIWIDTATAGSQYYLATWVLFYEVRNVIYARLSNDPFACGITTVFG